MEYNLEATKAMELIVREIVDKVQDECNDEMFMLSKRLKKRSSKGMDRYLMKILGAVIELVFDDLMKDRITQKREIEAYVLMNIIFEAAYMGDSSGKTYGEFLGEVFDRVGVALSDSDMKRWAARYRRFVSRPTPQMSNLVESLKVYKMNKQLKGEGNKTDEGAYYKSVLPFQEAAREYDVLLYPWHKEDKDRLILESLERFALERFSIDKEVYQKKGRQYKKLARMHIPEMNDEQLRDYMEYTVGKCSYIEKYEDPMFIIMGNWVAIKELRCQTLLNSWCLGIKDLQRYFYRAGCVLCVLIHRAMTDAGCETDSRIWEEAIKIANRFCYPQMVKLFMEDMQGEKTFLDDLRNQWRNNPTFLADEAVKRIQESFVSKYLDQDQRISDFIEIILCCNYVPYNQEQGYLLKLTRVFQEVFWFLKECKRKEGIRNANEELLSIRDLLTELRERLIDDIELSTDCLNVSFNRNESVLYFAYIYEKRYIYLENCIRKAYAKEEKGEIERLVPVKDLAEQYLHRVINSFPRMAYKNERADMSDVILNRIIGLLYPNVGYQNIDAAFKARERVLKIADSYGFKNTIWFV